MWLVHLGFKYCLALDEGNVKEWVGKVIDLYKSSASLSYLYGFFKLVL